MRLKRNRGKLAWALVGVVLPAAAFVATASGEVAQKQGVKVSLQGALAPKVLPRQGTAPVSIQVAGSIASANGKEPPQLRTLSIAINREGHISSRGLPVCRLGRIDPATTREAMEECGTSLVGEGHFSADVKLPEQSPFPSEGKVLAFNGRLRHQPAIFAQIFGRQPIPTSYVLPFLVKPARGAFGTRLEASLPSVTGNWGFVKGISLQLGRDFTFRGKPRSFIVAGCPAPRGFATVPFPLMRSTFGFEGGLAVTTTLTRTCHARG